MSEPILELKNISKSFPGVQALSDVSIRLHPGEVHALIGENGAGAEMVSYTLNGCAPEFALWSFVDLGYLTYYVTYLLATGQMEAKEGVQFEAGRMGTYTITKDPTRDAGLRVLMGPFTVYDETNVEAASK